MILLFLDFLTYAYSQKKGRAGNPIDKVEIIEAMCTTYIILSASIENTSIFRNAFKIALLNRNLLSEHKTNGWIIIESVFL